MRPIVLNIDIFHHVLMFLLLNYIFSCDAKELNSVKHRKSLESEKPSMKGKYRSQNTER